MTDYTKLCKDLQVPIEKTGEWVAESNINDAVDAIEQLQAENARLKTELENVTAERDTAVSDLYRMGGCPNCKNNIGKSDRTGVPICKKKLEYPSGDCFEWRGAKGASGQEGEG